MIDPNYVDTRKQIGDPNHLKTVSANHEAAEKWLEDNDGVAFEYEVLVRQVLGSLGASWVGTVATRPSL